MGTAKKVTCNAKRIGRASLIALSLTLAAGSAIAVAGGPDNAANPVTAPGWKQICKSVDLSPMASGSFVNPLTRQQCRYFIRLAESQSVSTTVATKEEDSNQLASQGN